MPAPTAYVAVCHTCRLTHRVPHNTSEGEDFNARHVGHDLAKLEMDQPVARDVLQYHGNASVKQSFGSATGFTITNANLASSATAGWMSNAIDNSSNLYVDALVHTVLAAVNTAPANSKAIFQYAYGLIDTSGSAYTSSGDGTPSGSEGTITFPDVTTLGVGMPTLGIIPYPVQNKAINGGPFSVAACFSGILPAKWGICMINHSGMTLSVTSIKYQEVFFTVA